MKISINKMGSDFAPEMTRLDAVLIRTMQMVSSVPGLVKPFITPVIPDNYNDPVIIIDEGLNPDYRSGMLYRYTVFRCC